MADRNQPTRRNRSYRDNDYVGSRQAEQYQDTSYDDDTGYRERDRGQGGQMGESGGPRPAGAFYYEETMIAPRRSRGYRADRGYGDDESGRGSYEGEPARYYGGASRYDDRSGRGFQSFTSEDQGGGDFVHGGRRPYGGYGAGYGGGYSDYSDASREYRGAGESPYGYRGDYGRDERGFFERAGDEVASWFGDEDAARRRRMDHRGRGPDNYTRSDERILEDACDNLTDDWRVDARNIQVTVKDAEVTLDGAVDNRFAKRRAEDCVDGISGVKHVQNNLRVQGNSNRSTRETAGDAG